MSQTSSRSAPEAMAAARVCMAATSYATSASLDRHSTGGDPAGGKSPTFSVSRALTTRSPYHGHLGTSPHLAGPGDIQFDHACLLYTSDAADDLLCVDLGGRR